jgi:isopentenyl-diphosphate delta-isomerase
MTAMAIMIPTWLNGKLQPFEKLAAHQQGLRHKAVSVFVIAGSQILIQQRALEKYHTPGLWAKQG